jgi:hypothetical protein
LEVALLEEKLLLSSSRVLDSLPHTAPCIGHRLLDLNGRITGYLTLVGSSLEIVSAGGWLEAYGKAKASGTFSLTFSTVTPSSN